jgi:CheY-like chemotaxis protein
VDDNATFCEVLQRQASHWGMSVHTALSASEGLAWLRNQANLKVPVDVVLVDADLPEALEDEWLERLCGIANQPVLILLASRTPNESERLARLGVRRVLLKPINHTSLRLTLEEELNYREQRQPSRSATLERVPLRCLAAEDNVINARVLVGMLEKLGVETTLVGNGQQAVEACQRHDFDIVLMDCDMPIMDGWEAARRIREVQGNRGVGPVPIIALTANTVEELGERARHPVMDAHLVKPINLRELRALLERWTGREVVPPPLRQPAG